MCNQVRVFAIEPSAQSRLNAVYMLFYYLGAALGSAFGVQLMTVYGWPGVMTLATTLSASALLLHAAMPRADKHFEPAAA